MASGAWLRRFSSASARRCGSFAQTPPPYVFSGPLLPLLLQMPENSWLHANANLYSNVWTSPSSRTARWMLHAAALEDHRGVERICLGQQSRRPDPVGRRPRQLPRQRRLSLALEHPAVGARLAAERDRRPIPLLGQIAIDGVDNAPISSHTYDNNLFLPVADRFLTWGGAAYDNGGPFIRPLESNPTTQTRSPAHICSTRIAPTATRSAAQRARMSGACCPRRSAAGRCGRTAISTVGSPGSRCPAPTSMAAPAMRPKAAAMSSTSRRRTWARRSSICIAISLPISPIRPLDQIAKVGAYAVGVAGQTTCGYDPVHKLFVRTGNNTTPFQFWDLTTPGSDQSRSERPGQCVHCGVAVVDVGEQRQHPELRPRIRSDPRHDSCSGAAPM